MAEYIHLTDDHAIALCPKCAHVSIKTVLSGNRLSETTEATRITLFLRDPMERFHGMYSWLSRGYNEWRYRKMVDALLAGHYNEPHYISQTKLYPNATEIIPFERLGEWWADNVGTELPHKHKSVDYEYSDYRLGELRSYYADDLALR